MNIIAIDCGASLIKGGLFQDDKLIKTLSYSTPEERLDNSNILQPIKIVGIINIVKEIIHTLGKGLSNINLSISNEMHGFLLTDKNYIPKTEYLSWQWELGAIKVNNISSVEKIRTIISAEDIKYTGMPLRAGLPSSNMLYLKDSGYLDNKQTLKFFTLGDYILAYLSNQEPNIHPTNAAATGFFDLRTNNWNKNILNFISENNIFFPKVGNKKIHFKLDDLEICAYPAIGDQQAALLGANFFNPWQLSFNIGTGGQTSVLTKYNKPSDFFQIRPYFNGYYLKTIPHIPSGRALNVYFRFIKDIIYSFNNNITDEEIWNVILQKAKQDKKSNIKCDLSFFENTITNITKGSISNIDEFSLTLGNLSQSIFKQMADNYVLASKRICKNKNKIKQIVFSGGIARKIELIRNYILKSYGQDIKSNITENETLLGLCNYVRNSN